MSLQAVLLPLFVEVGLTFFLMFWMGRVRIGSIKRGDIRIPDIALGERIWPGRAQQVSNAFHNQFELPILFYVLVILAIISHSADMLFVVMSWLFVLARLGHAYVHTTSNRVPLRMQVFAIGAIILVLMWVIFALRVLLAL
jgi:hypothetical protein